MCALLLAACAGPDSAQLRSALVDKQKLPAELAGCMAPKLAAELGSDSVHELMDTRIDTLPAEDAKVWADVMAACSGLLGYLPKV